MYGIDRGPAEPPALPFQTDWPTATLKVGESFSYARPTGIPESALLWSQLGNVGFLDQSGVFRALRPGVGKVRVRAGGRLAEVAVRVEAKAPPP